MDLKNICNEAEVIAAEAAEFIRKESERFDISFAKSKGLHDFASYVDLGAEKIIVEKLGDLLPEAGFLVEEGTSIKKGSRYCWVVDPLDGTTNFMHKLHPFAISIALSEYGEPIAGVVYEASGNERFSAWKDGGSWLNGNKICVSENTSILNSLISTGFPYNDFERLDNYLDCLQYLMKKSQGVRRMGAASVDLAYVACGRYEAFFEYGLKPWDIAAGMIIIKEAGGAVSDFSGNNENLSGSEFIGANSLVFPEFLEIVSKFMAKRK
jgi:myo-inositol-1(or 4)-monophosphatase